MPFGPRRGPDVRNALVRDGHPGPDRPGPGGPLLPITRYLRGRGLEVRAPELLFAQGYLQAITQARCRP